jgi:hypothetical protein
VVYASWNGSTQTGAWQVLAGPNPGSLSVVVRYAERVRDRDPDDQPGTVFQVRALNTNGKVLGTSKVTKLAR